MSKPYFHRCEKIRELRSGNAILIDGQERICTSSTITLMQELMIIAPAALSIFAGIPISQYLFKRMGFKAKPPNVFFLVLENNLTIEYRAGITYLCGSDDCSFPLLHIQFVHQVQNLVHSLTDTELILTV